MFLVKYAFIRLFDREKAYLYVNKLVSAWGRLIIRVGGGTVDIRGIENLPADNRVCFITNHQSYIDIPLIIGWVPRPMGAIGKHSLKYVPFLNLWLKPLKAILINRKNIKQSKSAIDAGIKEIKAGHPVIIAPEGTRSQSNRMAPFKPGSFKLAKASESAIVPLTIDGAYKGLEEKGRIVPAHIKLTIHPVIPWTVVKEMSTRDLAEKCWEIINKGLDNPNVDQKTIDKTVTGR